jgi:hypothetical protein
MGQNTIVLNFSFQFGRTLLPSILWKGLIILDQSDVDKFGNLCLISSNTNSRLWNLHLKEKNLFLDSTLMKLSNKNYDGI